MSEKFVVSCDWCGNEIPYAAVKYRVIASRGKSDEHKNSYHLDACESCGESRDVRLTDLLVPRPNR